MRIVHLIPGRVACTVERRPGATRLFIAVRFWRCYYTIAFCRGAPQ